MRRGVPGNTSWIPAFAGMTEGFTRAWMTEGVTCAMMTEDFTRAGMMTSGPECLRGKKILQPKGGGFVISMP
jgi:hypothetical protein